VKVLSSQISHTMPAPFGMVMDGRNYTVGSGYRYGFNGQEKENDISGVEGGHLVFEYRIHDARLGRFLSVDPIASEYPWNSSYAFAENKCIVGRDLEGAELMDVKYEVFKQGGSTFFKVTVNYDIYKKLEFKANYIGPDGKVFAPVDINKQDVVGQISGKDSKGPHNHDLEWRPIGNGLILDQGMPVAGFSYLMAFKPITVQQKATGTDVQETWETKMVGKTPVVSNPGPSSPLIIPVAGMKPGSEPAYAKQIINLNPGATSINIVYNLTGDGITTPSGTTEFTKVEATNYLNKVAASLSVSGVNLTFSINTNQPAYTAGGTSATTVTSGGKPIFKPVLTGWNVTTTNYTKDLTLKADGTISEGPPVAGASSTDFVPNTGGTAPAPSNPVFK